MEVCNRGYNSNLKNLLVKHQNNSVYWHRWRLLSGVSLICFYGIIWEIFLAELYGWLTPDERAFARLYPWNHEVAIFLGRRRESEVIYRKNCTCRGCFARSGLNTHPTPRGNWVFIPSCQDRRFWQGLYAFAAWLKMDSLGFKTGTCREKLSAVSGGCGGCIPL